MTEALLEIVGTICWRCAGDRWPIRWASRFHECEARCELVPAQTILPHWSPLLRGTCCVRMGFLVECHMKNRPRPFVGTWKLIADNYTTVIDFRADGTCRWRLTNGVGSARWHVDDSQLTITYFDRYTILELFARLTGSGSGSGPISYRILSVSGESIALATPAGKKQTLIRYEDSELANAP